MTLTRFRSAPRPDRVGSEAAPAVHLVTFGCQMNKYDSLLVEGRFVQAGYRLAARMEEADVILFNTCSVREHAEERVYSWVGELKDAKARRSDLVLGVMGCMAQRAEDEIFGRAAHVDLVCGTRQLQNLPALVDEVRARRQAKTEAASTMAARARDAPSPSGRSTSASTASAPLRPASGSARSPTSYSAKSGSSETKPGAKRGPPGSSSSGSSSSSSQSSSSSVTSLGRSARPFRTRGRRCRPTGGRSRTTRGPRPPSRP